MKKASVFVILALVLTMFLAGCRAETQNRMRRNMQDYGNQDVYITLYALDGTPIYTGVVDRKVTRADSEGTSGTYIYWFDDNNVYHQSDLPYLVTGKPLEELQGN